MRQLIITKNDSGQRLDKFLSKKFKKMPKSLMYKYLRKKYIKLNGKKCAPDVFLNENDILTFYIKDEFFDASTPKFEFMKASKKLDVLYEDNNIIIINKVVGVICHQDSKYDSDTLNLRLKRYLYEKKEYDPLNENSFSPALANRIDRNTCGIVIGAKNAEALRIINKKIRDKEIKKYYMCVTSKIPNKASGTLKSYLVKNEKNNTVKILKKPIDGSKEIITKYKVISTKNNLALCEIELLTGRTHQIRAHMASIGCPLVGDTKYGYQHDIEFKITKQLLCSYKIEFDFREDSGKLEYLNKKSFEIKNIWFIKNNKINI